MNPQKYECYNLIRGADIHSVCLTLSCPDVFLNELHYIKQSDGLMKELQD